MNRLISSSVAVWIKGEIPCRAPINVSSKDSSAILFALSLLVCRQWGICDDWDWKPSPLRSVGAFSQWPSLNGLRRGRFIDGIPSRESKSNGSQGKLSGGNSWDWNNWWMKSRIVSETYMKWVIEIGRIQRKCIRHDSHSYDRIDLLIILLLLFSIGNGSTDRHAFLKWFRHEFGKRCLK